MRILFAGLSALLLAIPAMAQKSLYWKAIDVRARLDDRGTIHVSERQTFVFDGDWNGGERVFRLEKGQTFDFRGMSRVDDSGKIIPMQQGSLDEIDHYKFTDAKTLRWRSRLPSDPPFDKEVIAYVLEYSLENIVVKRPGDYLLNHDFLFPDRSGRVERFTLDLEIDPAWDSGTPTHHVEKANLPPGQSVVLTLPLQWRGQGRPPSVQIDMFPIRLGLLALLLIVPVLLWNRLLNRERAIGRLAPLTPHEINREWIEQNLLPIRPEVVGAAWDEAVGAEEVSALLARWTSEGKIETKTVPSSLETSDLLQKHPQFKAMAESLAGNRTEMSMTLKIPRESFSGSERTLIDAFFYSGNETSTEGIRNHYKEKGFNPSFLLKSDLDKEAESLTARGEKKISVSPLPSLVLLGLTGAAFYMGFSRMDVVKPPLFIVPIVMVLVWGVSLFLASNWRSRVDLTEKDAGFRSTVAFVVLGAAAILIVDVFNFPIQIALITLALLIANSSMNAARSRRGAKAIAFRKKIASAREYFRNELKKPEPALDDRWFPYIIAFGLNDEASVWVQSFGGVGSGVSHRSSSSTFSSSSPAGRSSGWTGGGGAFGGAGASASWAAAASSLAAGVSAPSSSSTGRSGGSSGGGGGRSSSGGGGGGGW